MFLYFYLLERGKGSPIRFRNSKLRMPLIEREGEKGKEESP